MIKRIQIEQYRKLKNIELSFSPKLNGISGTNGTCKTSLLHLIGNSFQAVTTSCTWVKDPKCLKTIKTVNAMINPKVERLTRGDKAYNDPAHGKKGILFTVDYFHCSSIGFRRHNSSVENRYAIKPQYQKNTIDKLPFAPVIYLGLSRLIPYGEYTNDDSIKQIKTNLPPIYQKELAALYQKFTRYEIQEESLQKIGDLKLRAEFHSSLEGIDSNTISAGEDNLYIILTALISLKYYFKSIQSNNDVESVLLIDELDATLHPALQIKILGLLREYSTNYKIQVVFTTHSLSILNDMFRKRDNVIYFCDNISNIVSLDSPNMYKIEMYLREQTYTEIYKDKVIPIFTEDEEARFILSMLFSYFEEIHENTFLKVRRFFYIVPVNFGAENLQSLFKDTKLTTQIMQSICILDGDHDKNYSQHIISLPGKNGDNDTSKLSPEKLLFSYAQILYDTDDDFWTDTTIMDFGYGKIYWINQIKNKIDDFSKEENNSKKERIFNKELFNKEKKFFELLFKHWLHNISNQKSIQVFYKDLHIMFLKVATYAGIDSSCWTE